MSHKSGEERRTGATRLKNLLLLSAVSLVVLFAGDFFVRARYTIPGKGYGVWAAYPGSWLELVIEPDNVRTTHRYNRYGFRGGHFPIERAKPFRIACVGDSYTEGTAVGETESWPSALFRELSRPDVEVLNLGDGAADPARYAEIVSSVAVLMDPTDIIVCIISSDLKFGPSLPIHPKYPHAFTDPYRDQRKRWVKPIVEVFPGWVYLLDRARGRWPVQGGQYWNAYTDAFTEYAIKRVHTMERVISMDEAERIVRERMEMLADGIMAAAKGSAFNPSSVQRALIDPYFTHDCTVDDMDVPVPNLTVLADRWVKWFAGLCADKGVRPWILYFPQAPIVAEGGWGPMNDAFYERGPLVLGDTSIRDLVRNACDKEGVPFIDPTDTFIDHRGEKLFYRYDTHPTPRAHELVGGIVAEALRPAFGP